MISTVESNNGFRLELLPIALSGSSCAAKGLRSAILALSAFHRFGSGAALPYKIQALQLLSHSLETESNSDVPIESQLAASMMLCVYNVSVRILACATGRLLTCYRYSTKPRANGIST